MKGARLPLYGKGVQKTRDGHLRYTSPKELRGKYVHRKMVEDMLQETPWSIQLLIPWPFEVHHADFNKTHNCHCNFILMSESFHSAVTVRQYAYKKKFQPKFKAPPHWMPLLDEQPPF